MTKEIFYGTIKFLIRIIGEATRSEASRTASWLHRWDEEWATLKDYWQEEQ